MSADVRPIACGHPIRYLGKLVTYDLGGERCLTISLASFDRLHPLDTHNQQEFVGNDLRAIRMADK